uniref:Uncharacterized protein n=1 Tax=Paulinella chromatophora TaxID=39717 RepID=B1X3J7_PAUCH|nr:hypothetical protein PCC_0059 [Paulinella chromatophora]ACB42516.1 hypothetical protein PCC_0059 [Paulinella chromatophora]
MVVTRLSNTQKQELVAYYRQGKSTQALAKSFGCSPNTVSRTVKAALDPADYAALKQVRSRMIHVEPQRKELIIKTNLNSYCTDQSSDDRKVEGFSQEINHKQVNGTLEIKDADDFTEDSDNLCKDSANTEINDKRDEFKEDYNMLLPLTLKQTSQDSKILISQPLAGAPLPSNLYFLVDKSMELQPKYLREFSKLGGLSEGERERQALVVFGNPRQAKRLCSRTQRVIKLPDPRLLERTAVYLLARGISRILLEGTLYSLE